MFIVGNTQLITFRLLCDEWRVTGACSAVGYQRWSMLRFFHSYRSKNQINNICNSFSFRVDEKFPAFQNIWKIQVIMDIVFNSFTVKYKLKVARFFICVNIDSFHLLGF